MGSEGNSTAGLSSEAATPTTEELISQLRSSFFSAEFQNVTKKLMEREEDLKQKYVKLEKKFEEEKVLLRSEKLNLADELKKKQKELDELRKENLAFKDQIKALDSEKFRVEDDLKKKQREIEALGKRNADLERKVRVYEKRSSDFDVRVLSLEKIAKELMDSGSSVINLENKQQKTSAPESSRPPSCTKTKDTNKKIEPKFQEMILIDDDEEEETISTLKRKQVSKEIKREFNSDDDNLKVISTLKRTRASKEIKREHSREYELHNQPMISPLVSTPCSLKISPFLDKIESKFMSSVGSDSSSDSDNEKRVKEAYWSSLAKIKNKKRWEVEADMIKDFEKDDELCMNGICALQRQKIIVHGSDTSRIASLARLLIDGDPQSKLTKKASDLNHCDLDHCRMFARKYALQLFNIYQEQKDPFFPPRR